MAELFTGRVRRAWIAVSRSIPGRRLVWVLATVLALMSIGGGLQGQVAPTYTRYFADGATGFFDTSFGIVNLSATNTANVLVTYLTDLGETFSSQITLAPRHRQTVSANAALGRLSRAVSTIVESDAPIAADRLMRWGANQAGSSLGNGVQAPATTWYFAESATGSFALYYLIQNPNVLPAFVTVKYLRDVGPPIVKTYFIGGRSRRTIWVNGEDPGLAAAALGAAVISNQPIVVERAMYLNGKQIFEAGIGGAGIPQPSTAWYFAEGATGPFFDEFLTLLNPSTIATATVGVAFHLQDGRTVSKFYRVAPERRQTVWLNLEALIDPTLFGLGTGPVWISLLSDVPVVAERTMWWPRGAPWYGGHVAPGTTAPGTSWVVPEGNVGGPAVDATYILIANPTAAVATAELTLVDNVGATAVQTVAIGPLARLTVDVAATFGLPRGQFSVFVESVGPSVVPLIVDYSQYGSGDGRFWTTGATAVATPGVVSTGPDLPPTVASTVPVSGTSNASIASNLTVTFSERVIVTPSAFTLECPSGAAVPLVNLTPSPSRAFTLDPVGNMPIDTTCTLTVTASQVSDADADDPPDTMVANRTVTFETEGEAAPSVAVTIPANGAIQVPASTNITLIFREPISVTGNWFQIACTVSGIRNVPQTSVSGSVTTLVIDPDNDFSAGETCFVTVFASQVSDQDAIDPPNNMLANHTFFFTMARGGRPR